MSQQPSDTPDEPSDAPPPGFQYSQQYAAGPPPAGGYGIGGDYPGGFGNGPGPFGAPPRNSKLAITSLVLGLLSIPLLFLGIGPLVGLVGLILGIIGIAGAGRKNLKRGIGIAGIVLSIVGLVGGGLVIVVATHAVNACTSVSRNDSTAYTNCVKHNLKF